MAESLLEAALAYAGRGWPVFPCRGKVPWIAKRDGGQGFKDATTDVEQITTWWTQWPQANIGLATGQAAGVFVLDVDRPKGGQESLEELLRTNTPLPDTVQSLTGNGYHLFFQTGEHRISPSANSLGTGLDVRGDGGYVILPPSRHPNGKSYHWEILSELDGIDIAPAPAWLLELVTSPPTQKPSAHTSSPITLVPLAPILDGCAWMRHCQEDAATLSEPAWYNALSVLGRCFQGDELAHEWSSPYPKYDAHEVAAKLAHARTDAGPVSCGYVRQRLDGEAFCHTCIHWGRIASPISLANLAKKRRNGQWSATAPGEQDNILQPWRDQLLVKKNGEPTMNVANIGLILANHPAWAGAFWWDVVRSTPMLHDAALSQEDITALGQWLGIQERMGVSSTRPLEQCILAECHKHPRDLLQTWINTLPPWDQTPRLQDWLSDVAGVTKDLYGMAISRILPLSMIARVLEPGCLYRYVIIFEGPENSGKSSLVRAIASPEWYVELSMGLETKESHMMLQGAWVAEMPELDSLSRTEETRLKAFITLREDTWIPKYSNLKFSTARRTVFIGTTNDESYLKGETGNTRFLPIKTHDIDIPAFLAMREQIFAEAASVYLQSPATWWHIDPPTLEQATRERESRRVMNVYEAALEDWLLGKRVVEWKDIAESFLKLDSPAQWKDKSLQMQVGAAMKVLGWHRQIVWKDGKTHRLWERGPSRW
jgi:predicted P-loop ATPase